jgi:hypothetical protein
LKSSSLAASARWWLGPILHLARIWPKPCAISWGTCRSRSIRSRPRRCAKKLRDGLKSENFKLDQKQLNDLKQQMDAFRKSFKSFKPEDFKLDQKQMDELKQQMDQMKRQMEEMQAPAFGNRL